MSKSSGNVEIPLHFQPEWLRVTLASIGDAVITTDTAGRVTFLNSVAESLTGWSQNDANGVQLEKVFNIINQGTRKVVESPSVRALRDGVIVGLANHTLLIAKDGTERPIDDSAAPIRNDRQEVAGVVLVFRDITERYHHEQVLADSASYAANIIATLREPFLVLDKELCVHTANKSFYDTFEVKPGDTEHKFIYDLGNGQWNIPELRALLHEVVTDKRPVHDFHVAIDFPVVGKKDLLLNAHQFQSAKSSDLILLAIEDVTSRRRAEKSVQTSEVRYRRLFQSAKDGILILDAHTMKVVDVNPFMTDLLGYAPDYFIGKELWELGFFADKMVSQAAYRELKEHGYIRYEHLPLETRDGVRVEVEIVCNVYEVEGRGVAQCNIRDISERSRLEKVIAEQTAALADLHRRKDEFLAMLSHELRNPLAPIANALQLLRLQPDEGPLQRQARSIMERQLTQLTRLVDELMEVSRITTGRVRLRLETVVISAIIDRSIDAVRPLIAQHNHELMVVLPENPIWLHADSTRLEQVFVNLLTNAAKYTLDGGIISLSVQQEGDECVVRVRDTGVGIVPELLPRIFDLFTQSERSLDRSQGGLGIGLALVQRLVELHRGTVDANSSLGRGSEFVVRLPVTSSPIAAIIAPTVAEAVLGAGCRILVIDDN
ncbi:MAG: PAS domain S-box protein, partial [Gemmatimonadaceae bacterium]